MESRIIRAVLRSQTQGMSSRSWAVFDDWPLPVHLIQASARPANQTNYDWSVFEPLEENLEALLAKKIALLLSYHEKWQSRLQNYGGDRRLSLEQRVVYVVRDDYVIFLQARYHY